MLLLIDNVKLYILLKLNIIDLNKFYKIDL